MSEFRPSKKLGQNFLVDTNIVRRTVESAALAPGELVLEVGPGKGVLTRALLDAGARVLAVEMDFRLYEELLETFAGEERLEIIRADILDVDLTSELGKRLKPGEKASIVANLPYSVSSQAIFAFLDASAHLRQIVVMLQKEMAQRISAAPGSKTYGSISAAIALHGKAKLLFKVGPNSFRPRPKVDSAVVGIELKPIAGDEELVLARRIVRAAFARRRKQLRNSLLEAPQLTLAPEVIDRALAGAGIDPKIRAEQLSAPDFLKLSAAVAEAMRAGA